MENGDKFERLTFIEVSGKKGYMKIGKFLCECGNVIDTYISNVKQGRKKSCGCLRKEYLENPVQIKHGLSKTGTYSSWMNMIYRCNNSNATGFENYGGRGIKVCDRWLDFMNFLKTWGIDQKENQ